ncbi:hypothetical protein TNIN_430541 [Trichonephila inaurata madagascariensis]|uniref:Uncharacterized protein n=1 Tax=Trichonephila inaurata madagascariensis TaxID=2747483 RepID=A0A8X6M8M4_9ARAC|nr:hypothetical protein TNIN_430541 [Trichonephila inaurata madagascariensis]
MSERIALEEEMRLKKERWLVEEQMPHVQEEHIMSMKAEEQKCLQEERCKKMNEQNHLLSEERKRQKRGFKRRAKPKVTIQGDKAKPHAFWDRRKRSRRDPPPWTVVEKFESKTHKGQPLGSLTQRGWRILRDWKEKWKLDTCFPNEHFMVLWNILWLWFQIDA